MPDDCNFCDGSGCVYCKHNKPDPVYQEGWLCPKCECVNAPGNDRCVRCSMQSAAISDLLFGNRIAK